MVEIFPGSSKPYYLVNAVIHRDYSIFGSDIKMAIYDGML